MPTPGGGPLPEVLIEADRLTRRYGRVTAVEGLSFSVGRGEVVGFLGPNGAGKTTTMRMLAGYLRPTSGAARVAGYDVFSESLQARRCIGYMPEALALYPEMRVAEYLRYRARIKGVSARERPRALEAAMERCGVADVRRRLIGGLSKGYRQRVGLADALLGDPPILILDEPTIGLDPNQIRQARALIRELGKERTILLSTHILSEVEAVCRRALILHKGRLVFDGPVRRGSVPGDDRRTLSLRTSAPAEKVRTALAWIGDPADLEQAGPEEFRLRYRAGEGDPRERVFRSLAENGCPLVEMRLLEEESLEAVFVRLTAREDG